MEKFRRKREDDCPKGLAGLAINTKYSELSPGSILAKLFKEPTQRAKKV
jgi:hypothetical protein